MDADVARAARAAARDDHVHSPIADAQDLAPTKLARKTEEIIEGGGSGKYNTSKLGLRLLADGASALSAGFLIAPVITMIDRAIIENASGKRSLVPSFCASVTDLVRRPHVFLASRPFRLLLTLYSGTYLTANTLDTASSTLSNQKASTATSGVAKFAATSTYNLPMSIYKDSQLIKLFGTVAPKPVPGPAYTLFVTRDLITIFASFNLPPLLATRLPMSEAAEKYVSRMSAAQFIAPAAVQLISTPLHLLGLDLYNRDGQHSFRDRFRQVRLNWLKTSFSRMARIIPAFGVGGVVNGKVRTNLMTRLE